MAMDEQIKDRLMRFTLAAKAVIYDSARMQKFLQMIETNKVAITAVQSVMGLIEQKKQIPADLAPLLAVNIYMLMVDMAQAVTGRKPSQAIVLNVIKTIMQSIKPVAQPAAPAAEPSAPGGLMTQPAGV